MALKDILVWVNLALTLALIARLLLLRLPGVFRLFLLVLTADLLILSLASAMKVEGSWARTHLDYRVGYAFYKAFDLAVTIGIVYTLLRSFMRRFPGILKLSRRVLWTIVWAAVGLGLVLVLAQVPMNKWMEGQVRQGTTTDVSRGKAAEQKELEVAHVAPNSAAKESQLIHSVFLTFSIDQTVSMVLLLTLLSMLVFLLWFPVDVPRNTVIFAAGYIIFFAVKSLSLFFRYFSADALPLINLSILVVSAACYLYWLLFLTSAGETVPVRLGHRWKPQEQERLLGQLGAINTTLLRSARRS
jgi:hypothetical protein